MDEQTTTAEDTSFQQLQDPEAARQWLKQNPSQAPAFDEKYGPGKAAELISAPEKTAEPSGGGILDTAADIGKGVVYGVTDGLREVDRFTSSINPVNMVTDYLGVTDADERKARDEGIRERANEVLESVVDRPDGIAGALAKGITQFLTGFAIGGVAIKGAGMAAGLAKGAFADAAAFDPQEGNLSAFLEENNWAVPIVTDMLATDPDHPEWTNRARNAIEGMGLGIAAEALIKGVRAVALGRKAKETGSEEAAQEAAEAAQEAAEQGAKVDEAVDAGQPLTPMQEASELASQVSSGKKPESAAGDLVDIDALREFVDLRGAVDPEDLGTPPQTAFNYDKLGPEMDAKSIIRVVEEAHKEAGVLSRVNADQPESLKTTARKASRQVGDILGLEGRSMDQFHARIEKQALEGKDMAATLVAGRTVLVTLGDRISTLAKQIDDAAAKGNTNAEMEETFLRLLQKHSDVQLHLKGIQTAAARAVSAGRIGVKNDAQKAMIEDAAKQALNNAGGSKNIRRMAKRLAGANNSSQQAQVIREMTKPRVMDYVNEYWINAILSGPQTHLTNIMSGVYNVGLLPAERIVGGMLSLNGSQVRTGLKEYMYMTTSIGDAASMAAKSFMRGDNMLDTVSKIEGPENLRAISSKNLGGGTAVDIMGNTLRLPSRFLTAEDEFFKQLVFRSHLKASLSERVAAMTPAQIRKAGYNSAGEMIQGEFQKGFMTTQQAENEFLKLLDEGKVTDAPGEREAFIQRSIGTAMPGNHQALEALRMAREATFTTPLSKQSNDPLIRFSAGVQEMTNRHPTLKQLLPFTRTPTNLISVAWDRAPGLNLVRKQFREQLASPDPAIRAEARGKLATGVVMAGGLLMFALQGRITGSGPVDAKMRQTYLQDPNYQPSSINFGTAEEPYWVSIDRLDPHASLFGVIGDIQEMIEISGNDPSLDQSNWAAMVSLSIANNIVNKTYMQGLAEFFEIMNAGNQPWVVDAWLKNRAASFMPFSGAGSQVSKYTTPELQDTREMVDKMRLRLPGIAPDSPTRYSWLSGESVERPDFLLGYIATKGGKRDPVAEELGNLQYGFSGPERTMEGVKLSSEQFQEWNRLMGSVKLGGRTLKETLWEVMQSEAYDLDRKRIPDGLARPAESSRVDMLRGIVSEYKSAAKDIMLRQSYERLVRGEETPDESLFESYRKAENWKAQVEAGAVPSYNDGTPVQRDDLKLDFREGVGTLFNPQ